MNNAVDGFRIWTDALHLAARKRELFGETLVRYHPHGGSLGVYAAPKLIKEFEVHINSGSLVLEHFLCLYYPTQSVGEDVATKGLVSFFKRRRALDTILKDSADGRRMASLPLGWTRDASLTSYFWAGFYSQMASSDTTRHTLWIVFESDGLYYPTCINDPATSFAAVKRAEGGASILAGGLTSETIPRMRDSLGHYVTGFSCEWPAISFVMNVGLAWDANHRAITRMD